MVEFVIPKSISVEFDPGIVDCQSRLTLKDRVEIHASDIVASDLYETSKRVVLLKIRGDISRSHSLRVKITHRAEESLSSSDAFS